MAHYILGRAQIHSQKMPDFGGGPNALSSTAYARTAEMNFELTKDLNGTE